MKNVEVRFGTERALYGQSGLDLERCSFMGPEDGESALKECSDVKCNGCFFDLRYPAWHCKGINIISSNMTANCRAAIWYSANVSIVSTNMLGIKAVRECDHVRIEDSTIESPEFSWKTRGISIKNSSIVSEYAFFEDSNVELDGVSFSGKYSFQYVNNGTIVRSTLKTKDAFWHSKNMTVRDSTIDGEYLGWYSENLTLVNCHIKGTQPFCYCRGLKLINCTMEACDFAFEYSSVDAEVHSDILSIKNPISGTIRCDSVGEVMLTSDSKYACYADIVVGGRHIHAGNRG